jgi:hypothetical protein
MKAVILVISLTFVFSCFATEVVTDCDAMNEGRENVTKTVKSVSKTKKGSSKQ